MRSYYNSRLKVMGRGLGLIQVEGFACHRSIGPVKPSRKSSPDDAKNRGWTMLDLQFPGIIEQYNRESDYTKR